MPGGIDRLREVNYRLEMSFHFLPVRELRYIFLMFRRVFI